jgi:hypothetical protein
VRVGKETVTVCLSARKLCACSSVWMRNSKLRPATLALATGPAPGLQRSTEATHATVLSTDPAAVKTGPLKTGPAQAAPDSSLPGACCAAQKNLNPQGRSGESSGRRRQRPEHLFQGRVSLVPCVCVCVCLYHIYIYIYIYVCMYVYVYTKEQPTPSFLSRAHLDRPSLLDLLVNFNLFRLQTTAFSVVLSPNHCILDWRPGCQTPKHSLL